MTMLVIRNPRGTIVEILSLHGWLRMLCEGPPLYYNINKCCPCHVIRVTIILYLHLDQMNRSVKGFVFSYIFAYLLVIVSMANEVPLSPTSVVRAETAGNCMTP